MESKKINQLATEMSPAISDLTIIGDPITGVSKKITLLQIADLFQTTGTVTSVAVTESGNALNITGSPITTAGTINIGFAGSANQYVRGDGALAPFPTSTGGGSSVSYYLNGSVNQGTFGGSTYYQMSKNAIVGTGTNFSISSNGLIAQFITDANDPDVVQIPSGNWNIEFFMNVSASSGALASFYVEFYKYNGSTFTLLATNSATPEELTNTTTVDAYYTSVAMPTSALSVTDRLAIRIYANVASKTVTLYTEDNRLCQVVTTFSKGMSSLNNLTDQSQYLATGTSGTNFNIVSSGDTHTFNLPVASATNTGKLSSTDWSTFNNKQAALSFTAPLVNTSNTISIPAATSLVDGYLDNLDWVNFNTAYNDSIVSAAVTGTTTKTLTLNQQDGGTITASWTDINTDAVTSVFGRTGAVVAQSGDYTTTQVTEGTNLYFTNLRAQNAITLTTTGTSGAATYSGGTLNIPQYQGVLTNPVTGTGTTNTLPKFTGTSTIGNSNITDTGSLITLSSNVTTTGSQFVQNGFYLTNANAGATAGYTHMWGADDGIFFGLRNATGGAKFVFQSATSYNYTFPAATGTLALTSNLSAYLPLTGGTLTGALNGTSATFSSTTTATAFIPSGSTIPTNGMYLSAANTLNFATNSLNRFTIASDGIATFGTDLYVNRNIYVNNAEGGVYSDFYGRNSTSTSTPLAFLYGSAGTVTWNNGGTKMTLTSAGALQLVSSISATSATLNGNVIINSTATALSPLQVVATGTIVRLGEQSGTTGKQFLIGIDATSGRTELQSVWQGTAFTSLALQPSGGNVLIGTTGDNGAKLQVSGAATFSSSVGINGVSPSYPLYVRTGTNQRARFVDNGGIFQMAVLNDAESGYSDMSLGNSAIVIKSGGNVGINTSTPSTKLEVQDGANVGFSGTGYRLAIFSSTPAANADRPGITLGYDSTGGGIIAPATQVGTTNFISFWTYNSAWSEKMRITKDGSIGIGTSSPAFRLHVVGPTNGVAYISGSSNAYRAELALEGNGQFTGSFVANPSASSTYNGIPTSTVGITTSSTDFVLATSNVEHLRVSTGGRTQFSHSTSDLDVLYAVNGSASPYGMNITFSGAAPNNTTNNFIYLADTGGLKCRIVSNGSIYNSTGTYGTISDIKFKENIVDATPKLDDILKLKVRNFNLIGDETKQIGFIAQEFEQVFPNMVDNSKDKETGEEYKAIKTSVLIPMLVKAIQEQQQQIEELKALINK